MSDPGTYDLTKPASSERARVFAEIQTVCAGHKVMPALLALLDSAASVLAFAAEDLPQAERLIDELMPDMKKTIRENWETARAARVASGDAGHG